MSKAPLRVAIVGGGIGGCARPMRCTGATSRWVYEQASALTEVGAGVALQPNGIRIAAAARLRRRAVRAAGARWRDPQLSPRGRNAHRADVAAERAEQIEFYGMHRADLLEMLVDRLPGEIITTGHRCVGFEQDERAGHVTFDNGARVTADVVVGADGIHSALQRTSCAAAPRSSGSMAYRGVIPAAASTGRRRDAQLAGRRASDSWSTRCAATSC